MNGTTKYQVTFNDLSTDTHGLMQLIHGGRETAVRIGTEAGARFTVGRRVFWNIPKVKKYLDEISA